MTTFTSVEKPNISALDIIISNWDSLPLNEHQRTPKSINGPMLPLLKKYRNAVKNGCIIIIYEYSKNHVITGRQFAKGVPSLQGMKRWIRHTLAATVGYHDYDMVNCHPHIFQQYCKTKGWDTSPFDSYLEYREEYLAELMPINNITRDDAKDVIISILNGGLKTYKKLLVKPLWLVVYRSAIDDIHKKVLLDPLNAELIKSVKEYKKYNIAGSVMNHLLCNIENTILMEAIEFLHVKEPSLQFDGFMSLEIFTEEQLTLIILVMRNFID